MVGCEDMTESAISDWQISQAVDLVQEVARRKGNMKVMLGAVLQQARAFGIFDAKGRPAPRCVAEWRADELEVLLGRLMTRREFEALVRVCHREMYEPNGRRRFKGTRRSAARWPQIYANMDLTRNWTLDLPRKGEVTVEMMQRAMTADAKLEAMSVEESE
jgi:hypothetical protein